MTLTLDILIFVENPIDVVIAVLIVAPPHLDVIIAPLVEEFIINLVGDGGKQFFHHIAHQTFENGVILRFVLVIGDLEQRPRVEHIRIFDDVISEHQLIVGEHETEVV